MKSNIQDGTEDTKGPDIEGRKFDTNALHNVLSAIDKNRKMTTGYNNFKPFTEMPDQGNPYPAVPLAGKYMNEETGTM